MIHTLQLTVNGGPYELTIKSKTLLVEVLRDKFGLTGTKRGCISSACGACTVLLDGKAVKSCSVLALQANGREVTTIEGLANGDKLHPIQEAFVNHGGLQCGFCTPGMIMSAKALLDENPNPAEEEIRQGIAGNLCRCTGYIKIIESIGAAAKNMKEK